MNNIFKHKGFTLMELLIVVAIIAVLVAVAIPVFSSSIEKTRESADLANIRSVYANVMTNVLTDDDLTSEETVLLQQKVSDWITESALNTLEGLGRVEGIPVQDGSCTVFWDDSEKTAVIRFDGAGSENNSGNNAPVYNFDTYISAGTATCDIIERLISDLTAAGKSNISFIKPTEIESINYNDLNNGWKVVANERLNKLMHDYGLQEEVSFAQGNLSFCLTPEGKVPLYSYKDDNAYPQKMTYFYTSDGTLVGEIPGQGGWEETINFYENYLSEHPVSP